MKRTKKAVLDAQRGQRLKEHAMRSVEEGADLKWRKAADKAIRKVAETHRSFTADDVWATGLPKPREPRALGPELAAAERFGIIAATKRFRLTAQASRHRAPVRVWRSKIYKVKNPPRPARKKAKAKR